MPRKYNMKTGRAARVSKGEFKQHRAVLRHYRGNRKAPRLVCIILDIAIGCQDFRATINEHGEMEQIALKDFIAWTGGAYYHTSEEARRFNGMAAKFGYDLYFITSRWKSVKAEDVYSAPLKGG